MLLREAGDCIKESSPARSLLPPRYRAKEHTYSFRIIVTISACGSEPLVGVFCANHSAYETETIPFTLSYHSSNAHAVSFLHVIDYPQHVLAVATVFR